MSDSSSKAVAVQSGDKLDNEIAVPAIIDVEASGFGAYSYPVEIGVALSSGERISMLILPEPDWTHWDTSAQLLHGLSRETLMANGRPVAEVAAEFNRMLSGMTLFSDAWVVDKPWITALYHRARISMQFAVSPIEQIMQEAQFDVWDSTKQHIMAQTASLRHRASQDAALIQQTFVNTRQQIAFARQSPGESFDRRTAVGF